MRSLSRAKTSGDRRRFRDLRLSVTSRCNFACVYCEPGGGGKKGTAFHKPSFYVERVSELLDHGIGTVRITGGEPLLYPHLAQLVNDLSRLNGLESISITTNGSLLAGNARALAQAGLHRANVSLDAIEAHAASRMAGRDPGTAVKAGIDACLHEGIPVKLNATLYRGLNDDQVLPLLHFAKPRGVVLRFLELMEMGPLHGSGAERYRVSEEEVLSVIHQHYNYRALPRDDSSTARYFELEDGQIFGMVSNYSAPFCHDCDRLRMDSQGNLYGCLSSAKSIAYPGNPDQLPAALAQALAQKQQTHFRGSALSMQAIGG